jgi:hypothetical protein
MSLEIKGKIKVINPTETFGSGFTKREFVITTAEQYPQDVKFEVVKDKCNTLDKYKVGQEITVQFNIRGNEYGGKYYVSLQAWKIVAGQLASAPTLQVFEEEENTTLPF